MKDKSKKIGKNSKPGLAVIIPVYNHEQKIAEVVRDAKKLSFPVIVVDDGSTDSTYERIKDIKGITVLRHDKNMGKGAAIKTGFVKAAGTASWAVTIDADGQHDPGDIKSLLDALKEDDRPIVVGMRKGMTGPDVPWTSRFGRKFSNFWVRASGGPVIADSQSGFRLYPLPEAIDLNAASNRFQFEVEILVKAGWKKIRVLEAPVNVSYNPGTGRISHFRPFVDFMRNSTVFSRLIIMRIFIPSFLRAKM